MKRTRVTYEVRLPWSEDPTDEKQAIKFAGFKLYPGPDRMVTEHHAFRSEQIRIIKYYMYV